jgi:hypothetical protein
LPNIPFSSAGLKPNMGCPLNQNALPAASTTPDVVPAGACVPSGLAPLAGRSTVWNPVGVNLIESPTWIVVRCGK